MDLITEDPVPARHRYAPAVFGRYVRSLDGVYVASWTGDYGDASQRFNAGDLERGELRTLHSLGSDMLPTGGGFSSRSR